jgi:alpha-glucosidase (family GH31 glycosyl hydrolase)
VAAISRKVLSIRYSLLPYYYTLFFMAANGYPSNTGVWKPLFFDFPADAVAQRSDRQFMVGSALLISPQLKLGREGGRGPGVTGSLVLLRRSCYNHRH